MINAFSQIRLTNQNVYTSGMRLYISGSGMVYQSETGQFVTQNQTGGFVSSANTGNFVTTGQTGLLTNAFYPLSSNPAGYLTSATAGGVNRIATTGAYPSGIISGNVVLSGISIISITTGAAGQIVVSGDTGAYSNFVSLSQTGGLVSSANTGTFVTTGSTGLLTNVFYPLSSNPAGYITSSSQVGVRMIIPTGTAQSGNISGNVIFTGAGNVTVSTGISGHIVVSGNTGMFSNFVTLSQTGNVVNTSMTGNFASVRVTGSPNLPLVNLTGVGNDVVTTGGGGTVFISGSTTPTFSFANFTTTSSNPSYSEGRLFYDTGEKSLAYYNDNGSVTQNLGQENWIRVINVSNLGIPNGKAVYITGAVSGLPAISPAQANSESGAFSVGVTTVDIPQSGRGYITTMGVVHTIDVSGFIPGTKIYLSPTTTGAFTNTRPTGNNWIKPIGYVLSTGDFGRTGNVLVVPSDNYRPDNFYLSGSGLTGAGNVSIILGQGGAFISGNTGAYSNFITPSQTGLLTGEFYPLNSNPAGYVTSASAGVSSVGITGVINTGRITGNILVTGAGNVTAFTGVSGLVIISGNTGAYANFTTPGATGLLTGQFYPLYQNPSGYISSISGILTVSGASGILDGQLLIGSTGDSAFIQGNLGGSSGIFVSSGSGSLVIGADSTIVRTSQTGGFLTLGNVGGVRTLQTTGAFPSGFTSGSVVISGAGIISVTTGVNASIVISGTAGQVGSAAGVNTLGVTGVVNTGYFTGDILLSGAGNITVYTGASRTIIISGTTPVVNFSGLHNIWVPAAAMTPSFVTGANTGTIFTSGSGQSIDVLDFLSGSGQSAYFNLSFPQVWDKGIVVPIVYWTTTGNTNGTINWGVAAGDIKDGENLNIQYNQGTIITDTTISGNFLHQTTGAPLTISGTLADNDNCYFKVYRSAGGSLEFPGRLIGLNLGYYETGLSPSISGSQGGGASSLLIATGTTNSGIVSGSVALSGAGNISVFTGASNSIVISGNLTGAHEVWIPANAITPGAINAPTIGTLVTGNLTLDTLDFPQTGYYQSHFTYTFPNSWNTSTVKGQFYWTETGTTGTTGTVVWGLAAATIKNDNIFDIQFNTGQLVTGTSWTGLRMHQAITPMLTISGNPSVGDACFFKVYRNSGSLSGNAKLVGISLQYYHTGISAIVY